MRPFRSVSFKIIAVMLCPLISSYVFPASSGYGKDKKSEAGDPTRARGQDSDSALPPPGSTLLTGHDSRRLPPEEKIPESNPVQRWAIISAVAVGVGVLFFLMVPRLSPMVQKKNA